MPTCRIAYFANSDWYLYNFRAPLARAAREAFDAEIHFLCPDGPYRPKLEAMGFHWSEVSIARQGINPIREWKLQRHVRHILKVVKPDLLHNFTLKPVIWGSRAAYAERVPAVVNALAGLGTVFRGSSLKGRVLRPIVKTLLKVSLSQTNQRVIFQNPDDMNLMCLELGLPPQFAKLIRGSGVDTERFTPAAEFPSPPVVLFVGRLLRDKGIMEFCEAAGWVHAIHPDIRFRIAGASDPGNPSSLQDEELLRLAKTHPYLEFLGHVEDMLPIYQGSSLLVLPSTYGEGVPRSLIEAASCGLPLVATDHPGCREVVRSGQNGWLVRPHDVRSQAEAICKVLDSTQDQAAFGLRGRSLAKSEFSEHRVLKDTFKIYRGLGLGMPLVSKPGD